MAAWISIAVAVVGVFFAGWTLIRAKRAEKESRRSRELQELKDQVYSRIEGKIDGLGDDVRELHDDINEVRKDLKQVKQEVCEVSKLVAVHEDRFQRPPLKAVRQ